MTIEGHVEPGFEAVRAAFEDNFTHRGELGAGFVVRRRGRVVVDLWGGIADPETQRPWVRDTPCVVFSATKGLVAMAFLVLEDRGEIDLDAPASGVWPELVGHGKERIAIRTLLNHRSGLSALDTPLTLDDFGRGDGKVHQAMVDQVPLWVPDTDQGYGAQSWGAYTGELFQRITGTTVGDWLAEHVAGPLSADLWLGLPEAINARRARHVPVDRATALRHQLPTMLARNNTEGRMFRRVLLGRRTFAGRSLLNPSLGERRFETLNDPAVLALQLPWMGGVATADGLSRAYAALLGEIDGVRLVRPGAILPLRQRQTWSDRDQVLQKPVGWSQGFLKEELSLFSPNPASFGHAGAGGALGWADPDEGLAIAYVMNRMDWRIRSPRALALSRAVYASL